MDGILTVPFSCFLDGHTFPMYNGRGAGVTVSCLIFSVVSFGRIIVVLLDEELPSTMVLVIEEVVGSVAKEEEEERIPCITA